MAAQGKPEENGYAERLMRTIKEEEVDLSEYRDLDDTRKQIGCFIDQVYMQKRIHSALGYLTPAEFEADWRRAQRNQLPPKETSKKLSNFLGPLQTISPEEKIERNRRWSE